jgi:hypothetical protein
MPDETMRAGCPIRKAPFPAHFAVAGAGFGHISLTGSHTGSWRFGRSKASAAAAGRADARERS